MSFVNGKENWDLYGYFNADGRVGLEMEKLKIEKKLS